MVYKYKNTFWNDQKNPTEGYVMTTNSSASRSMYGISIASYNALQWSNIEFKFPISIDFSMRMVK